MPKTLNLPVHLRLPAAAVLALVLTTPIAAHAAAPSAAPALLVNGSFEQPGCSGNCILPTASGYITGWTTAYNGVEYFAPGIDVPDGVMVVDLAHYVYDAGGLRQTFATTPGAQYTLGFWAGNLLAWGRDGTGLVRVQVGDLDQTFATAVATTANAYAWRWIETAFTAQGSSSTLSFSNHQNAYQHFALIDGASVSAVPESGTWALMLAGLVAVGRLARRRAR